LVRLSKKDSYIKENPEQKFDPKWLPYLEKKRNNLYAIDIVSFNKDQLIQAGTKEENIIISKIDTAKDKRFFSHYRDSKTEKGDVGRFACLVGLKSK